MSIDIFSIQPHVVSRSLQGYSVFLYGEPKSGKTTMASRFPNSLLLAFEKGYNAIAGIMAQPINSWAEFRQVLKQLKTDQAKAKFSTIIIDTADIAYDYCTNYICKNAKNSNGTYGVDSISDIPFGKGYGLVSKEFDECLREIFQMDYGLVLISHATDKVFTDENGQEYNKIVPTLDKRASNVVSRLADIIGYSRVITDEEGNDVSMLFMRGTPRYMAGSRFKYTPDYIKFTYNDLVNAIGDSIDKQAAEDGAQFFTNERINTYVDTTAELDFDTLINHFNESIEKIQNSVDDDKFSNWWMPRIIEITDKYLGKGQKVSQCSREQTEALSLITDDLDDLIKNNL